MHESGKTGAPLQIAIGAIVATLSLSGVAPAASAQVPHPLFQAETEACFARVYDNAHLSRHPRQKVTSLYVFRALDDRPEAENRIVGQRDEAIARFRESGETMVEVFVTFRDVRGRYYSGLWCGAADGTGTVHCSIDCDGGSFRIRPDGAGAARLYNNGFVLTAGCGEPGEGGRRWFSPGKDDKEFRLDRKPAEVCRAEEQKAKPVRVGQGKPLRERFRYDEHFCLGSDYDAAHLARHPKQKVASIRVMRTEIASDQPGELPWYWSVKLQLSLTLTSGGAVRTARYDCSPEHGSWYCSGNVWPMGHESCAHAGFHLVRSVGEDVLLFNRRDALPIESDCIPARYGKDADGADVELPQETRSDDEVFRLRRLPMEACR